MLRSIYSRFTPRVAVEMPDHPLIAHFVTGSRHLLMCFHGCNAKTAHIFNFITVITVKAPAEALRFLKFIIINFGLWVIMGRITGTATGRPTGQRRNAELSYLRPYNNEHRIHYRYRSVQLQLLILYLP